MNQSISLRLLSILLLTLPVLAQQEKGQWRAANQTARTITGDVLFTDDRISIDFVRFTISRARALESSETSAAFDADASAPGSGNLYRVNIPAGQKFLNRNTICGSEPTLWIASFVQGRSLKLAFFSSEKPPVFTLEALANNTDLCGTFTYAK